MSTLSTRRDWLRAGAFALPGSLVAISSRPLLAAIEPISRIGGPRLKPAVNAYSFVELLTANARDSSRGIDLFQVCDFCAEQNCDAVDLTGYFFPGYPAAPDPAYVRRLKRHAFDRGLAISGTGVRNDFTAADKSVRAEGVARLKTWIDVAVQLGAPVVRAFADSQSPFANWQQAAQGATRRDVETWMADALRECAEYGERRGVIVAVQNHGDFINTGAEHVSLLAKVDHPWCAALVDTGKYLTADPYADIAAVAPYAVNWQIKETLGSSTDSPPVDMRKLVSIIRQAGYRGYVPIETLAMKRKNYDPHVEVARMLAALRGAIADTEMATS